LNTTNIQKRHEKSKEKERKKKNKNAQKNRKTLHTTREKTNTRTPHPPPHTRKKMPRCRQATGESKQRKQHPSADRKPQRRRRHNECRAARRTTRAGHDDRKLCKGGGFATLCITLALFFGGGLTCSCGGRAFAPG